MSIIFIRHGRTAGNERHAYIGAKDEPLSPNGAEELRRAKEQGFYPAADRLYISPMKRCAQTAAILYPALEPVVVGDFKERNFGRYEGKTFEELKNDAPYMEWVNAGGTAPFPAGEADEAFRGRVIAAFERMCEEIAGEIPTEGSIGFHSKDAVSYAAVGAGAPDIAVIAHGGTIMTILHHFFAKENEQFFDFYLENGDYYVVSRKNQFSFNLALGTNKS